MLQAKKLISLLLSLSLTVSLSFDTSSNYYNKMARSKIILIGDSITQQSCSASLSGFGAHLSDVYQRRADVYNRGFSGYNTDWLLHYMTQTEEGKHDIFTSFDTKCDKEESSFLVTIFMGANDASDAQMNPRHHVPLDRFQQNLHTMVSLSRQNYGDNVRIIMIGAPPVHHQSRLEYQIQRYGKDGATGKLERTLKLSGQYAAAAGQVASKEGLPFLNLWEEMQTSVGVDIDNDHIENDDDKQDLWKKYLSDGLHLSAEGNIFVGKRIVEVIEKSYPEFAVIPDPATGFPGSSASTCGDAIQYVAPWHDEIDYKNAVMAFDARKK